MTESLVALLKPHLASMPSFCRGDLNAALLLTISIHARQLAIPEPDPTDSTMSRLRRIGYDWSNHHGSPSPLLATMRALTAGVIDAVTDSLTLRLVPASAIGRIVDTGHDIVQQILLGHRQACHDTPSTGADPSNEDILATSLLRGTDLSPDRHPGLADNYLVVAPLWDKKEPGAALPRSSDDLMSTPAEQFLTTNEGFILIPADSEEHARQLCLRAHRNWSRSSGEALWLGMSWRGRQDIPTGRQEASLIARLAHASKQAPGVFRLGDVLMEYALTQNPAVVHRLLEIASPITRKPALLAALSAVVAANGNRSRAAEDLLIHRSTLDYRLKQIAAMSGLSPNSPMSLRLLANALTVHAVLHR